MNIFFTSIHSAGFRFDAGTEAYVKVEQLQCKKFIRVMIINSVIVIAIKMNKLYMNIMYM